MTYSEKLRDPRWQKKRLQILERDGWACCACKSTTNNLQVHHLIYAKCDPWDYKPEALQTLCDSCHSFRQQITDRAANRYKLWLSTKSNDEIQDAAEESFQDSVDNHDDHHDDNHNPDLIRDDALFREHLIRTMDQALAESKKSDALLHYDLLTDLMMALFYCNILKESSNCRSAETLMAMAEEKLEGVR